MDAPEKLIFGFLGFIILFMVAFVLYEVYINSGPSKYDSYKEVFPVEVVGLNALGKGTLLGYQYAIPEQIDRALSDGMRVPGVTSDVYVAYGDSTGSTLTTYPNFYKAQTGDFDQNLVINWPVKSDKVDNTSHTFLVFLYGYKPVQNLASDAVPMLNTGDLGTQKVLPFSSGRWNTSFPWDGENFGGNEPFFVNVGLGGPDISNANKMNEELVKMGYKMPTLDQYHWAVAHGLGVGLDYLGTKGCIVPIMNVVPWKNMPDTPKDIYDVSVMKYLTPLSKCITNLGVPIEPSSSVTSKGSDFGTIISVWGDKKAFKPTWSYKSASGKIEKVFWKVLPFNSEKESIYDK